MVIFPSKQMILKGIQLIQNDNSDERCMTTPSFGQMTNDAEFESNIACYFSKKTHIHAYVYLTYLMFILFHTGLFSVVIRTMLNSFMFNASPRRKFTLWSSLHLLQIDRSILITKTYKRTFPFVQCIGLYTVIYICVCSIFFSDYKHGWYFGVTPLPGSEFYTQKLFTGTAIETSLEYDNKISLEVLKFWCICSTNSAKM